MNIAALPETWRGRAMIVSDVADPERWFDSIPEFPRAKRRLEWMLSRIAEKELRRRGAAGTFVSYSHSGMYGAAAIGDRPIGIDVEMMREIRESAAHLFLIDAETEVMQRCTIAHPMLHFWSAKEAAWKQLGGSVPTLKKVRLTLESEGAHGLRFQNVETFAGSDFVAALTHLLPGEKVPRSGG
ncbi:MAG TPA: 4'-phosphopantetheinyl transferase superfamily protein [Thermoanaerobaculia bacterium]|nr:4'-phosphopantetheinyl transferase superfamily protein [Thermoanaerobaculia bacterium]